MARICVEDCTAGWRARVCDRVLPSGGSGSCGSILSVQMARSLS